VSDDGASPLLLLGPTASGKSALALRLAERLPIEIISVDSAQVYRGLDIGTAKPDADERARVAHHLIDIREPDAPYSAATFVNDARVAMAGIRARGRLPLLAGGTMLYARALIAPLDDLPPADPQVRRRLEEEAARDGWPALHQRLASLDPVAAARIGPTDPQRIQRALEVIELTGRPLSAQQLGAQRAATRPNARAEPVPTATPLPPATPAPPATVIAIEPSDRAVLHARIAERFDAMLASGLVEEVRGLLARPGMHADLPAMRAVGYRQVAEMLAGEAPDDPASLRDRGIAATRQLAKRQLTWLRSLPVTVRFDCLAPTLFDDVSRFLDDHRAAIR